MYMSLIAHIMLQVCSSIKACLDILKVAKIVTAIDLV